MKVVVQTYALFSTIPFLSFFVMYYLILLLDKPKALAKTISMHITALLLYTAVTAQLEVVFMIKHNFIMSIFWVIFIFSMLGFFQWKIKRYFDLRKLLTSTSKLCFISFSLFYLVLFFIGVFKM